MAADLDRDVRAGKQQRPVGECAGDRDRHHEAREHDPEHEEPHGHRLGIEHVRHPGRVVPRPPDDEQDERGLSRPAPRQVAEQQMRDLRDREHEDEVVEQLQIGGVLLLVAAAKVSAHRGATLSIRAAGPACTGRDSITSACPAKLPSLSTMSADPRLLDVPLDDARWDWGDAQPTHTEHLGRERRPRATRCSHAERIRAETAGLRALELGFSDRAVVYLNGQALPRRRHVSLTRLSLPRSIGYYDTLFVPLVAGDNDLWSRCRRTSAAGACRRAGRRLSQPRQPGVPSRQATPNRGCFGAWGRRTGSGSRPRSLWRIRASAGSSCRRSTARRSRTRRRRPGGHPGRRAGRARARLVALTNLPATRRL